MSLPPSSTSALAAPPVTTTAEGVALLAPDPAEVDGAGGPTGWVARHRDALREATTAHGALLVRGLGLTSREAAAPALQALGGELLDDTEGFAQRLPVAEGLWTSAAWPDQQQMCMHHELAHRSVVPRLLAMACPVAPAEGGATGLADAAAVLEALPADLVTRFEREGWLLSRCLGGDVGPSVEEAFGSAERGVVEAYCAAHAIEPTWLPDGRLLTRQRRAAVVTHPVTGRRSWFNQVAFLSEWTLDPEVREFLVDMDGEEGLPFATAYGDGGPVDAEVVALLTAAYDAHTRREPWQSGDLMLVDNVATAHSRDPFTGPREVVLALADPWRPPLAGGAR